MQAKKLRKAYSPLSEKQEESCPPQVHHVHPLFLLFNSSAVAFLLYERRT